MAMQIPEYVAQGQLNTERSSMPNVPRLDAVGLAMQRLGSSIGDLGAHLQAKAKQKQDTADAFIYEDATQKNKQASIDSVNNNTDPYGTGIHDNGLAQVEKNNQEALAKISKENQAEYAHKLGINASDHSIWLADKQHEQARGGYTDTLSGITGNKAAELQADPSKWKQHLDDTYKYIDNLPDLYPHEKADMKAAAYKALAEGKAEGDLQDPAKFKLDLGVPPTPVEQQRFFQERSSGQDSSHLNPHFSSGLQAAITEAEQATGTRASIRDLYRPPERQAQYYANYTQKPVVWAGKTYTPNGPGGRAAPPGLSKHQTGNAADVNPGPVLDYLHAHQAELAQKYGLSFLKGKAFADDSGHIQILKGGSGGYTIAAKGRLTNDVADTITKVSASSGVPAPVLAAFSMVESSGGSNPGRLGVAQLQPGTAKELGVTDVTNVGQSIEGQAKYIKQIKESLTGALGTEPAWSDVYLGYQQGPTGAAKLLRNPNDLAVDVVGKNAVEQNGGSADMTAKQFTDFVKGKYDNNAKNFTQTLTPEASIVDPAYAQMPTAWRIQQSNRADAALNSETSAAVVNAKALVDQRLKDDYASIVTSGVAPQPLEMDHFIQANPKHPEIAVKQYEEYSYALSEASKIHSYQNMGLNDLVAKREDVMKMVGTGEGAALRQAYQAKELAVIDARTKDLGDQVKTVYDAQQAQMKTATEAATIRAKDAVEYFKAKDLQQQADLKTTLEKVVKDIPAAMEADRAWSGELPSPAVFQKVWPGAEGTDRYNNFIIATQGAHMRSQLGDAPTPQLLAQQAALDKSTKSATGNDAAATINEAVLTSNAIQKELKARLDDPSGYVLLNNPVVAKAFSEAQANPTDVSKSQYAIKLMIANQRYLGIPEDKLSPLPKPMADAIVTSFKNPDANVTNASIPLIHALQLTDDKAGRAAIMKQAVEGGLPPAASEGMIAYLDGREPQAMRLLQAARQSKDIKNYSGDTEAKTAAVNTAIYDALNTDRAKTEWGDGYYTGDGTRVQNLHELGVNYVRQAVAAGMTVPQAVDQFSKDLFPDKTIVRQPLRDGNRTNFNVPPGADVARITSGLNSKMPEIKQLLDNQFPAPGYKPVIPQATGLITPGTITNLFNRPELKNADGTYSTTLSFSREEDGKEVLVPQVIDGKKLTEAEAWAHYKATGEHLGKFDNAANADKFAQALHDEQAKAGKPAMDQASIDARNVLNIYKNKIATQSVWISYGDGYALSTPDGLLTDVFGKIYTVTPDDAISSSKSLTVPRTRSNPGGLFNGQ